MTVVCRYCPAEMHIPVTVEQIERWRNGALIQKVMPELSRDQREMIMTRMCPACWGRLVGSPDDDD